MLIVGIVQHFVWNHSQDLQKKGNAKVGAKNCIRTDENSYRGSIKKEVTKMTTRSKFIP